MKLTAKLHPADAVAGLSLAGLLLPEAVAYSGLANLPPQAGVIGLFAGLVCYAIIGRSRYAIVTATSSSAAVLAAATLALGADVAAQRLAFATILVCATGIAFLLAGIIRSVGAWQPMSLAAGVGALLGLFLLGRLRHIPGVFLVIAAGIAAAPWLSARGVALTGPI